MGALDIYDQHRMEQVENGVFSEDFILDPSGVGTIIKGIFDEAYATDNQDQGNVRQQRRTPVILLASIPAGITPQSTQITVRGVNRTIYKVDRDENGIPRMWLL